MTYTFQIIPMPYKRMTRFSKFNKGMLPYYGYQNALRLLANTARLELPDRFGVTFHLPMPPSWSKSKRERLRGQPHQQKPDVSNLLKALEDALKERDETIWGITSLYKFWSEEGRIEIEVEGLPQVTPKRIDKAELMRLAKSIAEDYRQEDV